MFDLPVKEGAALSSVPVPLPGRVVLFAGPGGAPMVRDAAGAVRGFVAVGHARENLLLNAAFRVNQRGLGDAVSVGNVYAHDMWSGGAGGVAYTLADGDGVRVAMVTAGTLRQLVDGARLSSGPVCLHWQGTAKARINGGAWGDSPVVATATAKTMLSVEFGVGSVWCPKLEGGSSPTSFLVRDAMADLMDCQRYLQRVGFPSSAPGTAYAAIASGAMSSTTEALFGVPLPVVMRAVPGMALQGGAAADFQVYRVGRVYPATSVNLNAASSAQFAYVGVALAAAGTAGQACFLCGTAPKNPFLLLSSEL